MHQLLLWKGRIAAFLPAQSYIHHIYDVHIVVQGWGLPPMSLGSLILTEVSVHCCLWRSHQLKCNFKREILNSNLRTQQQLSYSFGMLNPIYHIPLLQRRLTFLEVLKFSHFGTFVFLRIDAAVCNITKNFNAAVLGKCWQRDRKRLVVDNKKIYPMLQM